MTNGIDKRKGRKIAQNLQIPTIGTLGILLEAKNFDFYTKKILHL